jgi:hypothetical protein
MSRLGQILKARALRKVFDAGFYLRTNPDVAAARVDPLRHYVEHGAAEQRQPHPLFDPAYYLACCPEARGAENPLLYFLRTSCGNTHPLFDCEAYGRAYPDAGNPLTHYLGRARYTALEGSQFGQC